MTGRLRRPLPGRWGGFTLIEMLVVIAVIAVLVGIAIPSLATFQRTSELRSVAGGFLAALQAARTEAMKRGLDTYVVPATGSDWSTGWTVFADANLNQSLDTASDPVLLSVGAIPSRTAVASGVSEATAFADGSSRYVRFNGGGFPLAKDGSFRSGAIEFTVSGSTEKRRVVLNAVGRARLCNPAKDTSADCKQ